MLVSILHEIYKYILTFSFIYGDTVEPSKGADWKIIKRRLEAIMSTFICRYNFAQKMQLIFLIDTSLFFYRLRLIQVIGNICDALFVDVVFIISG